jgi:hypothetical protein
LESAKVSGNGASGGIVPVTGTVSTGFPSEFEKEEKEARCNRWIIKEN